MLVSFCQEQERNPLLSRERKAAKIHYGSITYVVIGPDQMGVEMRGRNSQIPR